MQGQVVRSGYRVDGNTPVFLSQVGVYLLNECLSLSRWLIAFPFIVAFVEGGGFLALERFS